MTVYADMSQKELAEYARIYNDNDDGSVSPSEIEWAYVEDFPVSRLLEIMPEERWNEWVREEIELSIVELEDPNRWAPLLVEEIHEPVVLFDHPDGTLHIWDGWHRSGSSVVKGAQTLKAVLGAAPGHVPRP